MRKIKIIGFILLVITILLTAGVFVYWKLYGKNIIENTLSKAIGRPIKYESFELDLTQNTVKFKDFRVPGGRGFTDEDIFSAGELTAIINREELKEHHKVIFEHIIVKNGTLIIERNRAGEFNLAYNHPSSRSLFSTIAYAQEDDPTAVLLLRFAEKVRKLTIRDSIIEFKDYYIYQVPFTTTFDNFQTNITTQGEIESGYGLMLAGMECAVSFGIPNDRYGSGEVAISSNMAVYADRVDTETRVDTKNVDVMQFQPYFVAYTPFVFNEGVFRSSTNFSMHDRQINSLTTMVFRRLLLFVKPGQENAEFLGTTANRLVPYLTTGSGEIVFDFTISGPSHNPQFGLGPKVKQALVMLATEDITKAILKQMSK